MEDKYYTTKEAAHILRMSHRGVLLMINQKRIKATKVGKQWLISEDEVRRLLEEGV